MCGVRVCVVCVFIDINSMPHYMVMLHALHKYLSCSFTVSFAVNYHKSIDKIYENFYNNVLTFSLTINNIYIHALRSISVSLSIF